MISYRNKIIHVVTPSFFPAIGGTETNILEVYSVLAKNGWKVIIHTSKNTLTQRNVLPTNAVVRGLIVRRYKASNFGFSPYVIWHDLDLLTLHNFDLFSYSKIFLYTWFLKIVKQKKFSLIITPHCTLIPAKQWFSLVGYILRKLLYPTIVVFLINKSVDGIRTVSEWEKKKLIAMGIKSNLIKTISNGIEETAFSKFDDKTSLKVKQLVKKFGRYIIQVGRINKEKNYEVVIKALKLTPIYVKYLIVGPIQDKYYYEDLRLLVNKLHLDNRVVFSGKVELNDKYYLIKHAQMMVHMSLSEAFGNAVHEGMSQGLPCIVSNTTALPYLVKQDINGFCLNPKDHRALAAKVAFLLDEKNKKIIQKMKEVNIRVTKNQTWEKVALEVEKYYIKIHKNFYKK